MNRTVSRWPRPGQYRRSYAEHWGGRKRLGCHEGPGPKREAAGTRKAQPGRQAGKGGLRACVSQGVLTRY
jgi:hypothetical protein